MKKERNVPELSTFTLLNPDFHSRVDQTVDETSDDASESEENTVTD